MCRKCASRPFEEDALNLSPPSPVPNETLMPWTLTTSPYLSSPPLKEPSASEKVTVSVAERLATMPPPAAPLTTVHLPPIALRTFTSPKQLPHNLPRTSPPPLLTPNSTSTSTHSKPLEKAMMTSSLSLRCVMKNRLRNLLKHSPLEYREHRIFKKGSHLNVLFP